LKAYPEPRIVYVSGARALSRIRAARSSPAFAIFTPMRIFIDENIPQGPEVFSAYGEVTTFPGRTLAREHLEEADVLLVRSITQVDQQLLQGTPVKFVGTATIGVDHVDQDYLRKQGIGFSAAPGCNARSVAEYFVAALLHLKMSHGVSLQGRTVGVVGFGNVGRQVAAIAPALGLKVLVSDPPLADAGGTNPYGEFLSLEELVKQSDIVTMHTPLTKTGPHPTLKMLNREIFAAVERPKVFMNMGRGEAMHEPALLEAHAAGKIMHLVLDVFPGEPNVSAELARKTRLMTPHIAGYSIQGKLNGTGQILAAFLAHFGLPQKSRVKMPAPADPTIKWEGAGRSIEEDLSRCVRRAYDITRDDTDLRAFVGNREFAKHFDALRKRYPVRHEFADFTVTNIPPENTELRARLTALGFKSL
jgi:erythronate-4-phosphate dehydrogenase